MKPLTQRQQDVLRYIIGFRESLGIGPTLREISAANVVCARPGFDAGSTMRSLEKRGAIRRMPFLTRKVEVLEQLPIPRAPDGEPLYFVRIGEGAA
jgi:SOS-response transcriptional repressor LexA